MAKRAEINTNLFAKIEPTEPEPKPKKQDRIEAKGAGLKKSEWAELDKIADDLGMTSHAVHVYAVRYFMAQYKAGKIKAQEKTVKSLPNMQS